MKKLLIATALSFGAMTAMAADIVDTAVSASSFKTLVAAVQPAGLVDTLKGQAVHRVRAHRQGLRQRCPRHNWMRC
ncbi:hypothetical protein LRS14_29795 [Aquincola sp. J276]|nr:hypothetical protein [Aquincola sp. J276]MCR5869281.1 hypothetical protein [Aquincola sp. J276]